MVETQLFFGMSKPKGGVVSAPNGDVTVTVPPPPNLASLRPAMEAALHAD